MGQNASGMDDDEASGHRCGCDNRRLVRMGTHAGDACTYEEYLDRASFCTWCVQAQGSSQVLQSPPVGPPIRVSSGLSDADSTTEGFFTRYCEWCAVCSCRSKPPWRRNAAMTPLLYPW